MKRSMMGATAAIFVALAFLVTVPAASASAPVINRFGNGSFSAPLTNTCTDAITLFGFFSNDVQTVFVDGSGNVTAIIDRFDEVDAFVGPTGTILVGDPYHAITEVRFDGGGNATSVYSLGVLERVTLPDGTSALFAGRLNLLTAPPGTIDFIPDSGHSSDLAGFCAALGAGQPLS